MLIWNTQTPNSVQIQGVLNQETLLTLLPLKEQIKGLEGKVDVDVSALEQVDSAGLALLLELKEQAQQKNIELSYVGTTEALEKLKLLYNVDQLIK
ncbi:lipid asymmetry maintenance protein MlaB [Psychrobium sp. 1_MG-2023]|uniref:STAS domain-containing protein n=1 Tax=Psychrobium sp. 1_MG-2023 TaxID=3062624 RepID=UPI000C32C5C1|nr:STAS domain-containing protein [Psychrobium sp. 1_MG-2023]MDP2560694.1 STAS domain-containing protein [Psychrobium sp. 1_MG-2023]PKF56589.1 anti-sigma B factor antagonist [Alteromonadales bacterium alter-6D02]